MRFESRFSVRGICGGVASWVMAPPRRVAMLSSPEAGTTSALRASATRAGTVRLIESLCMFVS